MPATTAQQVPAKDSSLLTSSPTRLRVGWGIPVLVAVVAFAVRLAINLRGGGLHALMGYDDGVYYAAAAKLLVGELPYRDFVLLHPPVISFVLAPFAELGRLTTDRDGMAVARVGFMVLGAVNAGLTARLASHVGRVAALVAGGFMAVWVCVGLADRSAQLQPVVTFMLLVALLLLQPVTPHRRIGASHAQVLAGVALGVGACTKIWGVAPFAVITVALLVTAGRRAATRLVAGATAAAVLVLGPFLLAAPTATIRMIVLDQVGRPGIGSSPFERLPRLIGVLPYLSEDRVAVVVAVTLVAGAALAAMTLLALRVRVARLWVALLVVHSLVLLAAPVFFVVYAAFIAVPLALVLGTSAALLSARLRATAPRRVHAAVAATAVAGLALLGVGTVAAAPLGDSFPGRRLASFVPTKGCVRSDSPIALIQLDLLSRTLRSGCDVPVDFTGITYDRLARTLPDGTPVLRESNDEWQQYARRYLTSGSSTVLVRGVENGFDDTTLRMLRTLPVLGRADGWAVLGPPRGTTTIGSAAATP
jgi:alpha-1,2-mannosyltransferase